MNNSTLKFPNHDKQLVIYKSQTFELTENLSNPNSVVYRCIHKDCGSMIELDSKRKKITNSNLEHMNHSVLPPLKQRLRSHKSSNTSNQANIGPHNLTKKISFSVIPTSDSPSRNKSKQKIELKTKGNINSHKTKTKAHPSRDTSQQLSVLPSSSNNESNAHTSDPSTSDITAHVPSDTINANSNSNPGQCTKNVTLSHSIVNTENVTQINIETQTDDFISSSVPTSASNQDLIVQLILKDDEIKSLKQTIASLEFVIQNVEQIHKNNENVAKLNNKLIQNSNRNTGTKEHSKNKSSCFIIGDSHVRGLQHFLSQKTQENSIKVYSHFQPGAGFNEVSKVHHENRNLVNPTSKDFVVLVCGTNDIGSTRWAVIEKAVDNLVFKFKHAHQICVIGVPFRYKNKKSNYHINRFNNKLKTYVQTKSNNIIFMNPNDHLQPRYYARDGLHLNRQGKTIICNEIKKCLDLNYYNKSSRTSSNSYDVELNPESTICHDLIVLDDFEESIRTHITNIQYSESTFSTEPHSNTILFPETSCIETANVDKSVLENTILSKSNVESPYPISGVPNVLVNPSSTQDYYRIANISQCSFSTNTIHSSPIPIVSSSYNRHSPNFREAVLKPIT